jgi:hypothetical protein
MKSAQTTERAPLIVCKVDFPQRSAAALLLVTLLLAGCATKTPPGTPPRIGHGAEEYQQLTKKAVSSVGESLHWLDRVAAQTNRCPPKIVTGFSQEVERLQIESLQVRSDAQAIQARGDAFFEAWSVHPSPGNAKAAEYLPQLHEAFAGIKQSSQQAGAAFRPFFSGLRKLRTQMELSPDVMQNNDTRELLRTTREQGSQVLQNLNLLAAQLHDAIPLLKRAKSEAHL